MASPDKISGDDVAWARRRNSCWIVHHGLGQKTEMYLDYLEKTDKQRLHLCCRNARLLVRKSAPGEHPKPWFYSGIFSLATAEEVKEHLVDHWFVSMTVCSEHDEMRGPLALEQVSQATLDKIQGIRKAIAELPPAG
jgi:hypothetical protein